MGRMDRESIRDFDLHNEVKLNISDLVRDLHYQETYREEHMMKMKARLTRIARVAGIRKPGDEPERSAPTPHYRLRPERHFEMIQRIESGDPDPVIYEDDITLDVAAPMRA